MLFWKSDWNYNNSPTSTNFPPVKVTGVWKLELQLIKWNPLGQVIKNDLPEDGERCWRHSVGTDTYEYDVLPGEGQVGDLFPGTNGGQTYMIGKLVGAVALLFYKK